MTLDQATELIRHALFLALLVAAPLLVVSLVVGLVLSVLQAATQVQEQTLTFIPKIVATVICLIALMPWIAQHLMEYARELFSSGLVH
jgi:flagellar biosynthesis protein FliQ